MKEEEEKVEWIVDYWSNGQKFYEIPWVNGQRHGIETWWREDGNKELERPWVNGQRHGIETWWRKDGNKELECPWVNAQKHGIETWWNSNGSLLFVGKWNQGQLVVGFEFNESEVPEGKVPEVDILTKQFNLL